MSSIEAIIDRQLRRWELEQRKKAEEEKGGKPGAIRPIVTVSRQRGSRGAYLAERLAEKLGYQLLHREVIDHICNSTGYRRQMIESLDNKVRSRIELWFEGVFKGLYVDSSDYFRHLYKVMVSIAELGGVVVVGRAANFILGRDRVFSIRVVAALPRRLENLIQYQNLTREQAERDIRETDRERQEFVRSHFRQDIDSPGAYDLVINTTYIDLESALTLAEIGIKSKWRALGIATAPFSG
ncbi:MAG: cytidylate kinase-like family protein [Candidatus Zixiibacteriota bacterium]